MYQTTGKFYKYSAPIKIPIWFRLKYAFINSCRQFKETFSIKERYELIECPETESEFFETVHQSEGFSMFELKNKEENG